MVLYPVPAFCSQVAVTTLASLDFISGFLATLWESPSHFHPEPNQAPPLLASCPFAHLYPQVRGRT